MGPDYIVRPKILIPENHRGLAGNRPTPESLADLPWWEVFKDPVLQELTREALRNNYDLRTAAAPSGGGAGQIGVARSFLYPQVGFNGGGSVQQVSRLSEPPQSFGASRTFQNWAAGFGMAWEMDVFGRVRREAEAASAVYFASERPAWCNDHLDRRYRPVLFHFARA